jgi:hypothetical protein
MFHYSGTECTTFRHRHCGRGDLIEAAEFLEGRLHGEVGDQEEPTPEVQWSSKGGCVLVLRRKARWREEWMRDRALLGDLLKKAPHASPRELAQATGRGVELGQEMA